jgi:hypothetical protein
VEAGADGGRDLERRRLRACRRERPEQDEHAAKALEHGTARWARFGMALEPSTRT